MVSLYEKFDRLRGGKIIIFLSRDRLYSQFIKKLSKNGVQTIANEFAAYLPFNLS